jgi:hypothetical protein
MATLVASFSAASARRGTVNLLMYGRCTAVRGRQNSRSDVPRIGVNVALSRAGLCVRIVAAARERARYLIVH